MTYKQAVFLAAINVLSYCLLAIDVRITAFGPIWMIMTSNFLIGIISYVIYKVIADLPRATLGMFAYAIGGAIGAGIGVWLTKFFLP